MALSRIEGADGRLYVGGLWALRRSDTLRDLGITHVLSLTAFDAAALKDFRGAPWSEYGAGFRRLVVDVDDVEDSDLLAELPRAVRFIADGVAGGGAVLVHCAAGKSRSVAAAVAFLLWRWPGRFDPDLGAAAAAGCDDGGAAPTPSAAGQAMETGAEKTGTGETGAEVMGTEETGTGETGTDKTGTENTRPQITRPPNTGPQSTRPRAATAQQAVAAALAVIRRSRPMAEPNPGFMEQLALWWEMGCPDDVEAHPAYQRWAYRREVEESVAAGQAPSRLRFEDEQPRHDASEPSSSPSPSPSPSSGLLSLRCKKCRRTLATGPFIQAHAPAGPAAAAPCPHHFVEPLSWMRAELERGQLGGRLACPNERCGSAVGRYDWRGLRCACGAWVTPGLSLQRARVDEERALPPAPPGAARARMGIRMPPGRSGSL